MSNPYCSCSESPIFSECGVLRFLDICSRKLRDENGPDCERNRLLTILWPLLVMDYIHFPLFDLRPKITSCHILNSPSPSQPSNHNNVNAHPTHPSVIIPFSRHTFNRTW